MRIVNTYLAGFIRKKNEELCCIKLISLFSICIFSDSSSHDFFHLHNLIAMTFISFVDSLCLSTYVLLILVCFKLILYLLVEMFDHDLFCCNLSKILHPFHLTNVLSTCNRIWHFKKHLYKSIGVNTSKYLFSRWIIFNIVDLALLFTLCWRNRLIVRLRILVC